jgi:hypothetical protein
MLNGSKSAYKYESFFSVDPILKPPIGMSSHSHKLMMKAVENKKIIFCSTGFLQATS